MPKLEVPTKKLTYEEFLEWCDEDTWAEWVDGEVVVLSPASDKHQDLADFLTAILRVYTEARGLGVVRSAPFQMKTRPELPGREPDILFIAKENLGRLKETYLDGPADLVIEITSQESRLRDRGEKFAEYELGGVKEYWLIDPEERRVDFYLSGPEGRYERQKGDEQRIYRSRVILGFWLKVDWLWQEPLPSPVRTVAEIAGVDPQLLEAFERALSGKSRGG
jgi:Uma2 family endonuclease